MNYERFKQECARGIEEQAHDDELQSLSRDWLQRAQARKYSYHFEWLGRPIIQYPQDVIAMQELIWSVQPDLIIETGIAHGGSLVFSASMLELNAACGGPPDAEVLGVDIEIRPHNREAIEAHPMFRRITMIEGSSTDSEIVDRIRAKAGDKQKVLVCLDSNHTHDHVLAELEAYAPLVSSGSYCVVFDTIVEQLPDEMHADRPWSRDDNPATAIRRYLDILDSKGRMALDGNQLKLKPDQDIDNQLLISVAPGGYLMRIF